MRKYLLPCLLVLALSASVGVAQTITKALQLSQDATGAFGVDANNGVYFPQHLLSKATVPPTVSGTGTPTIVGSDTSGTVTMGTSATTAVVLFGTVFNAAPSCVLGWQAVLAVETYSSATTGINITQTSASGNKIGYVCMSTS